MIELSAGLVARARATGDMEVLLSDCDRVHRLDLTGARPELVDVGSHRHALRSADVVHVHMLLHWTHLLTAAGARMYGARVVFSPMSMLGRDFGSSSWFRASPAGFRAIKPLLVRALRLLWLLITDVFVAASEEEIEQARLPRRRTVLVPLAAPDSPLARAALEQESTNPPVSSDAPVAFLTRFDVHRKGIDRMCAWLSAEAHHLPRPAVLLLAPSDEPAPEPISRLQQEGLLEWDAVTRGPDVLPRLTTCRAVMLLSRWDGQPRVLREAALAGIPTLSTANSHFTEVVRALDAGAIVDGDDTRDVQRGFETVRHHDRDAERARLLFDRDRIGAYLYDAMTAAAAGHLPACRSYYEVSWTEGEA